MPLVTITLRRRKSTEFKSALTQAPGLNPEHVMVCFQETQWENWAFGGGRIIHA